MSQSVPIRRLSERTVCRIAAGEVIDRPAGAVKELVENALDAGADDVRITLVDGGRTLIAVTDNGHGIPPAALPEAVARHATSKLKRLEHDDDLVHITTYGFRGEALAALGASARLRLISRTAEDAQASLLEVDNGRAGEVLPAAGNIGTRVEVHDLFAGVPARLKFLKTDRAETTAALDAVRAVAGGAPGVAFTFEDGRKTLWQAAGGDVSARIDALCGAGFSAQALPVELTRDGVRVHGRAGNPGQARGSATHQWLYVNGRRVRDKMLAGALRAAYRSVLDRDSHAAAVLYLEIAAEEVDVNVHPAKTEVRFRDADGVRGLLIGALMRALEVPRGVSVSMPTLQPRFTPTFAPERPTVSAPAVAPVFEVREPIRPPVMPAVAPVSTPTPLPDIAPAPPLGFAKAQLHRTYIVAENAEGLVLVDQHAAHERLTLEKMRARLRAGAMERQALLLPLPVTLTAEAASVTLAALSDPDACGFAVEPFGGHALLVREIPTLLPPDTDVARLIRDFADRLRAEEASGPPARELIDDLLADCACRYSIRAGRALNLEEMNALLREIERTPNADRCNHGRPTVLSLSLKEVERLFGRRG